MTKEHAWPQWLGRDVTVEPTQHSYSSGFSRTSESALTESDNVAVQKQASVLTSRIREVCAECNNGWMSRLEVRSRPLLERLWAPSYPLGSTTFDEHEMSTLATWATKTAWVRERVAQRSNTADAATRQLFARTVTPPRLSCVWASRHLGEYDFAAFNTSLEVSHQDQHWATGERRSVLLCTLVFRGLAMLVRTDSGDGVPPSQLPDDAWAQIWPARGSLSWPPARPVTDQETYMVAKNTAGWLRMPPTTDFHRSGDWQHRKQN